MTSVLHVLPHPGGGGKTYVDSLSEMAGYEFEPFYLAPGPSPREALPSLVRTGLVVHRRAREHDLLHVHGEVAAAVCLPSLALRPSVVTLHGLHLLRRAEGPAGFAARVNLRLVLSAASRVICVSDDERSDILGAGGSGAENHLVVIHNGVPHRGAPTAEERTAARSALDLDESAVVGTWLGSLDDRKDPLVAVRAASKVVRTGNPLVLLLAGDGPLRQEVERAAGNGGAPAARILGFRDDIRNLFAAADFFVMTSHREGLSYALLEAMSMGLPAVVSDAPGNAEAVGDTGIVVPRGQIDALAEAFVRLVRDPGMRRALGDRARVRAREHFSLDEMVDRTARVYEAVLSNRHASP